MTRPPKARHAAPQVRILLGSSVAIGPGKAALIEAIDRTGSISAAARDMGMSYRRAWDLVDIMNRCFRRDLVTTATGGSGGGGARVTAFGRDILARYRAMEETAQASIEKEMTGLALLMRKDLAKG
ncbi:MAG TPA: LysR family transcriptional regulator [Alphaproteobacteria bacterium]|nr:LysR family transcriptional regulator [Alphaproteobacteria bacterium]